MQASEFMTDAIIRQHWQMLRGVDDATRVKAFAWVERLTGVAVSPQCYAPSGIGITWIRQMARPEWLRPLASTEARWRTDADLAWFRPVTDAECAMQYVHLFDANAAYPAVIATNDIAVGEPVRVDDFRPKTRSIYLARVRVGGSGWDGHGLPSPLFNTLRTAGEQWWYEPQVRFAIDNGWSVEVLDGYIFPETHAVLRNWAQQAWEARESVKSGPVLSAMMKAIIKRGMGMMDSEKIAGKSGYRPDWWGWIKSENRRRRMESLLQQHRDNGAVAFAVDIDCIAIASNERDPARACPIIMRRPASLGGYKHVKTVRNPGPLEAHSANNLVMQLKALPGVDSAK